MKELLEKLYPLNRTIVSDDNDKAIGIIKDELKTMNIIKIPTGTECWTWIVPEKWVLYEGYISDGERKIIDIKEHILHVISYSLSVDKWISKEELMKHIHFAEEYVPIGNYKFLERPDSIPWVMKYYERDWGFCIKKNQLSKLKNDKYYVKIDTEFISDYLKIGELTIPGEKEDIIVIISNICHPYQVNDSISGLVVAVDIAKKLMQSKNKYTYKFLFLPETIGSIAYLSKNEDIIPKIKYAIFSEMLGHKNSLVLQKSFQGNSKIDRISEYVLKQTKNEFRTGNFREVVCNDEGVFNGPGVNIPTISLTRWPYPEFHTSDDNPSIINENMLEDAKDVIEEIIRILENDYTPIRKFKGPVFLSRYNLWIDWHKNQELNLNIEKIMMNLEGKLSVFDIADKLQIKFDDVLQFVNSLYKHNLIDKKEYILHDKKEMI